MIRRAPVEKPKFVAVKDESKLKEQGQDEQAFLLAWLGLGSVIFLQGILLSISGTCLMTLFVKLSFSFLKFLVGCLDDTA